MWCPGTCQVTGPSFQSLCPGHVASVCCSDTPVHSHLRSEHRPADPFAWKALLALTFDLQPPFLGEAALRGSVGRVQATTADRMVTCLQVESLTLSGRKSSTRQVQCEQASY